VTALRAHRLRARTLVAPPASAERLFARPEAQVFWDGAVALGEAARVEASGPGRFEELRRRAAALYARIDGPAPPLFGGLAFAPAFGDERWAGFGDASFILPRWLYRDGVLTFTGPGAPPAAEIDALLFLGPAPPPPRPTAVEHGEYTRLVEAALVEIAAGRAEKIVVARQSRVSGSFADAAVVARLPQSGLRFAFRRGASTFLGATPERLVEKRGLVVHTEAVAGTSLSPRFSDKDRAEHAPVVAAIVSGLSGAGGRPEIGPAAPRASGDLVHLVTPIRAAIDGHLLDVAAHLHPTPAVGGAPGDRAVSFIRANEAPRGWYAGAIGWFNAAGDGELRVALRCALLGPGGATLYAGAGIVAASRPDAEDAETLLKERPLLRALGAA
jgi:hypothetical protein